MIGRCILHFSLIDVLVEWNCSLHNTLGDIISTFGCLDHPQHIEGCSIYRWDFIGNVEDVHYNMQNQDPKENLNSAPLHSCRRPVHRMFE